ncbi:unnamed protein product [Prunus brigantina]
MVVMDDMSFSVVEEKGFRRFCNSLNPNFQGNSIGKILKSCFLDWDMLAAQISSAWCSGPRGRAFNTESYFWVRCGLCAGVPARSTVRRMFGVLRLFNLSF